MPIVSSQIVDDKAQVDGRRHVIEQHVDHVGGMTRVSYMAEAGADANAMLTTRAALIDAAAAAAELAANVEEVIGGNF
jgi:hypothetical protein